ncbi:hypothetical protein [Pantoea sp. 18069]|uniref:hypothetical protein n=1 Tax=Pantoea sp. 18069 TaxID=2681415 RepID=UPI001F18C833|nr:hypothetical protein [Pantoea sp. 18069]
MKHLLAKLVLAATSMGAALCIIKGVVTPCIAFLLGAWALVFGGLVVLNELRRERQQLHRASMRPNCNVFRPIDGVLPQAMPRGLSRR